MRSTDPMATLSSFEIIALVAVVIIAIVLVALMLLMLRRLRSRKSKLLGDLDGRPELDQDRAFNRIAMARREASLLKGQGVDVRRAQELIAEAQGAFDTRSYDQAYRNAQSAHEALVNARLQGATTTDAPLATAPSLRSEAVSPPAPTSEASPPAPRAQIPKYRTESQFQLELLGEELGKLPPRRARDPAVVDATALRAQATTAFHAGDFTEAFRLALRGRRTLGVSVETVAPSGPAASRPENGGSRDVAQTAEKVAGGERCPDCGYPALGADAFCRGCGRPRAPLTCGSCGAPRVADEPFCGQCGTRFA